MAARPGGSDAVLAQAVFEAVWDLLTRARRGERVTADTYRPLFGEAVFARPDVGTVLYGAQLRAEAEAAGPRGGGPVPPEVAAVLDLFGIRPSDAPAVPYLDPPSVEGDLGRLAHFRVMREVGRGAMGVVFEAVHERNALADGRRALKVLPPATADAEAKARFLDEANHQYDVQNRHVAAVFTAAAAGPPAAETAYIEMEYVYGPTLLDLIEHFRRAKVAVPLPLAADLIRQAATGLAAAHGRIPEVVHRDVKPGNVLLQWVLADPHPPDWRVVLCDFGLARAAGQSPRTAEGYVVGTTPYLSPEQCDPPPRPDGPDGFRPDERPADVFALGIIFYELVTDRHPFLANTKDETLARIILANPKPPRELNPALPAGVEELILRMLAKDPARRPAAANVAEQLSGAIWPSGSTRKPSPGRPRRWRAFVVVSVAALACTTVVFELVKDKTQVRDHNAGGVLTAGGLGQTINGKTGGESNGGAEPAGRKPGEWPVRVVKTAVLYAFPFRDDKPEPPRDDLAAGTWVTLIGGIDDLNESSRCRVRLSDGTEVWVPSSCLDKD